MIGGEGQIVEVDETKIGKRKYNLGRVVDRLSIFGMVEGIRAPQAGGLPKGI